jgi:hypothetical protein
MPDSRNPNILDFDESIVNAVEGGGVYGLATKRSPTHDEFVVLYVGMASNLKERLRHQLNNPPIAGISHFFFERIDNEAERVKRERKLLLELMPVGNALESLTRPTLMEAAYLAARVLWHRSLLSPGEPDRVLGTDYFRSVPGNIREAANHLLRAIEAAEGKPVTSLDRDTAARYLNLLSDTIRNRSAVDVGYDPNLGQDLLSRLRESQFAR